MVSFPSGPGTVKAAHRVLLPWPNAGKCPRINLDIRFLATTLETEANCTVQTASFNAKDCCKVLDGTQFKNNTVTYAQDISTTSTFLETWVFCRRDVPGSSGTGHAPQ